MISKPLAENGTIGLCSPCRIVTKQEMMLIEFQLRQMGFNIKESDNLYSSSLGYGASPEEKAHDLMQLMLDDDVDLVMFGGGEGCNEVLPYLDFQVFKDHPKRICAFSDSTTLLNTIWANTGLEVYYGQSPSDFAMGVSEYNMAHFKGHILSDDMTEHVSFAPWVLCNPGKAEGVLFGGYALNTAFLLNSKYFNPDPNEDYILFVEDHEQFGEIDYVSSILAHIEQSPFMKNIKGLLFGNYSFSRHPEFYSRLERLGKAHDIPVAYCDDFGHGETSAIIPIGRRAILDTMEGKLTYLPE